MPNLRTIISELELALQNNTLSNPKPVTREKLIEQIKNKRASEISRKFEKTEMIPVECISELGVMDAQETTSSDDPDVPAVGLPLAKIIIPATISLVNNPVIGDHGLYYVASPNDMCQYYEVPLSHFYRIIRNSDVYVADGIYTRHGDKLLLYPYKKKFRLRAILFDPLEGYHIDTSYKKSGELNPGDDYNEALEYEVSDGQIEHDNIIYNAGDVFTATATTFIGGGKVRLKNQKRPLTEDDFYPMESKMKDAVIKRILMEDYAIELQMPADNKSDGKSESELREAPNRVRTAE